MHTDSHVSKKQFAVTGHSHPNSTFVFEPESQRVRGRHVNMAKRADHTAIERDTSHRAFEHTSRRTFNIAGFSNGRKDAELELLGHRNLHLSRFSRGAQHP